MEYNLLAPIIVGGSVVLIGLAVLVWMNNSEPKLQLSARSEDDAHGAFERENNVDVARAWYGDAEPTVHLRRDSKTGRLVEVSSSNVSFARRKKIDQGTN